jgi:hypothetical protein
MKKKKNCPQCEQEFVPKRKDQVYCSDECRHDHNNEKKKKENEVDYEAEKRLRKNAKILKKILNHPFYKGFRIDRIFLEYERFDFNVVTTISEISVKDKPNRRIQWHHKYGIEVVEVKKVGDVLHQLITIHQTK